MRRLSPPGPCEPLVRRLYNEATTSGLTMTDLAQRSGVADTTIYHWMHHRRSPTIGNLVACFNAIGLDLVVVPMPARNAANDARASVVVREVPFG